MFFWWGSYNSRAVIARVRTVDKFQNKNYPWDNKSMKDKK